MRTEPPLDDYHGPSTPGAALLVLREGRPPERRAVGLADVADRRPVTPRTNFRLASMTKAFTAKAVDLLVGDGALRLDAPIRDLLPALPAWADRILIGHLLTHTSGIAPYESLLHHGARRQLGDRDVLHLLADGPPPAFEPGSRFAYDNGGYVLLGLALEEVSGRAFPQLLEERIFRPLGMTRTVAHVEGRTRVEDRALGYRREGDGRWVDADQGVTTATLGDGGIYSSLEDLARWDAALRKPGYAPDPGRLAAYAAPAGTGVAYGWGWYADELDGRRRQRHEGWSTGFQNEIQRFPDEGLTVIVLTNRAEPPVRPLAELIARGRTS